MTHLSQIVCEHVVACSFLKVLKQAHVSCCGCRVTVGGIPLMQGEMVVVNVIFQRVKFGVTPAIPSFTMESLGLFITHRRPTASPTEALTRLKRLLFLFALEHTQPFIQVYFISLQWHSAVSTVKVVACEDSEPGKYRLLWEDSRHGRCSTVNGSCSWPAGGVNGMVWSALLSVNETRQSPAEQLQSAQPPSQLIVTWDDPEESVIVWKGPERKKKSPEEGGDVASHSVSLSLSQWWIENTSPWYDTQGCSRN